MAQPKNKATDKLKTGETVVTAAEIDPNSPEADRKVIETLYRMVTEDKNTTVAIFWAKARCGMHEKPREKERKLSQAPTIVIRTEEKKA
jgi:hypothetical protein